jgi:hypothetical protein
MPYTAQITVTVSGSGAPIPGALITYKGKRYRADSSGKATVWFDLSDVALDPSSLTLSATGYQSQTVPLSFPVTATTYSLLTNGTSASTVVLVRSKTSKLPLAGVSVYADANIPAITDSNGRASLSLPIGQNIIKASKTGYVEQTLVYTIAPGLVPPAPVFDLDAAPAARKQLRINIAPPAGSADSLVHLTSGALSQDYSVNQGGYMLTADPYGVGDSITILVTKEGWVDLNTTLTVQEGLFEYTLGPLQQASGDAQSGSADDTGVTPAGLEVTDSTAPGQGLDSALPLGLLKPADSYEYTYPSGDFGKYFTTSQARMYIGNLFVDELNTVQYVLQGNKIPIYGYASRDFDAVGQGKALVQGQIYINFISEGYLYTILKENKKLSQKLRSLEDSDAAHKEEFNNNVLMKDYLLKIANKAPSLPGNTGTTDENGNAVFNQPQDVRLQFVEQRMAQLAAIGPSIVDQGRSFQPLDTVYANAVYLPVAFDLEIELEGAGRVVKRRLEKCYLGANEQIMDQSGNVIGESYSFIARRLR